MSSRLFFDTAPLIYFFEQSYLYYEVVKKFLFENQEKSQYYTSSITDLECLTLPYRLGNTEKIEAYKKFLEIFDFKKIDISSEIAEKAAELRGKYEFLKNFDSLQIASCICFDCDFFVTNDKQLLNVEEVKSILVANL